MLKSPIERSLHGALRRVATYRRFHVHDFVTTKGRLAFAVVDHRSAMAPVGEAKEWPLSEELGDLETASVTMTIAADVVAVGYRADLVVECRVHRSMAEIAAPPSVQVIVECDGHEWHERTPQQAARDRARDREIVRKLDVPIIRFAGTEISRDPDGCAVEVIETCLALHTSRSLAAEHDAKYAIACHERFR